MSSTVRHLLMASVRLRLVAIEDAVASMAISPSLHEILVSRFCRVNARRGPGKNLPHATQVGEFSQPRRPRELMLTGRRTPRNAMAGHPETQWQDGTAPPAEVAASAGRRHFGSSPVGTRRANRRIGCPPTSAALRR